MARRILPTSPSAAGLYLSALPTLPASGVSSLDGSGPYMIEEQWMDFDYVRVPVYEPSATSFSLTKPTVDYRVLFTQLLVNVKATYQRKKVYAFYKSPSWTQNQKFQYLAASCDAYGNCDYGDVGISALGPAGSVVTIQKWYFRRLWNDTTDTEVISSMNGSRSYYETQEVVYPYPIGKSYTDALVHWGEFDRTRAYFVENTFLNDGEYFQRSWFSDYKLPGSYTTGQETEVFIQTFINNLGQNVTDTLYYPIPYYSTLSQPPLSEGVAQYSITRHDFS